MSGPFPSTAGNAVPPLDNELADLLDDLEGIHAGIDLIRDGIRLIALERLTVDRTQTLSAVLAGSTGCDVLTLIGVAVARITNPDSNPALRSIPFEQQKEAQLHGEKLVHHLADDTDLHQHASEASAAITGT